MGLCALDCSQFHLVEHRLLSDAVINFQQGQEEISLVATPVKLVIKNHVDEFDPGKYQYHFLNVFMDFVNPVTSTIRS